MPSRFAGAQLENNAENLNPEGDYRPDKFKPVIDNPAFDYDADDDRYTPSAQSQQARDIVSEASGRPAAQLNAITDRSDGYGQGGGYWSPDEPGKINVDPIEGGVHVTAHELGHSNLMSDVGRAEVEGTLNWPRNPEEAKRTTRLNKNGANLRRTWESFGGVRMNEEAHAQGVARGVTDRMGLGNVDGGFRNDPNGLLPETDEYGNINSLAYPRDVGLQGFGMMEMIGGTRGPDGRPLPIGMDPKYNDAQREEYYTILENMPGRLQQNFNNGYTQIPQK